MIEQFLIVNHDEKSLTIFLKWASEFPDEFLRQLSLDSSVLTARLDGNSAGNGIELIQPIVGFRASFDLAGLRGGVYTLTLFAERDGQASSFWTQLVCIQHSLRRSPEEVDRLAKKYAPVLLFSPEEEFFPVSLRDLVITPPDGEGTGIDVETVLGKRSIPFDQLDLFLRTNGHADYLLDQSGFGLADSSFYRQKGSYRNCVVYYSYMEDEAERSYINYHTFYAFDPKTGIAKLLNVGPHIFDRESLTVMFEGDVPVKLTLGAHLENQPIFYLEKLLGWTQGRTTVRFDHEHTPLVNGHPVVAVAEGSHALYPSAGTFHISVLTEIAGHIFRNLLFPDLGESDMNEHQVILPPGMKSRQFASYDLRPLRLDLLQSDPHPEATPLYDPATAALMFSGYWVDVPGFQNERFPPFSKREMDVRSWVEDGFEWTWDVPESVKEHNRAIVEYIRQRI